MTSRFFRLTRFGRLIIILMITLTLLTMVPIAVGRARNEPNELETLGFGVCEGRPCFMGIVPGVTSWSEAYKIAQARGSEASEEDSFLSIDSGFASIRISRPVSENKALDIRMIPYHSPGISRLGQVLLQYGLPCQVIILDMDAELFYPYMVVGITQQAEIALDTPIISLSIIGDPKRTYRLESDKDMCRGEASNIEKVQGYTVTPWLGFKALDYYKQFVTD